MKYFLVSLLFAAIYSFSFFNTEAFVINGTVTDFNTGAPVEGASVSVKNHNTVTDSDGNFTISVSGKSETLICVALGYERKELKVNTSGKKLNIRLTPVQQKLDEEVVVAGYGVAQDLQGRVGGIAAPNASSQKRIGKAGRAEDFDNFNTEDYDGINENRFKEARNNPLSTFSIDVDGASYSNVRRFLKMNQLPPAGAVRIEELVNYFHYDYPQPKESDPFSIQTELANCPWNTKHKLLMIGLQGKRIPMQHLPASNLVFLIDVSGSMNDENKLPLVKSSLKLLTEQLREQDKVSIVVYAGNAGLVLPSTSGSQKQAIRDAIENLEAGGSTAGGEGIQLAYKVAKDNFIDGANNRVILCTDGDFNIGASSDAEMEKLIEKERESGVYLTVLGYGMGNYKDNKMQKLADKGNGNHAYIDEINEAKKVLVNEFGGTLFTIAKDVKLQVEFNPAKVQAYRLIGYENRMLHKEDFNNDKKDAGDIGSGHTVTALYELIPIGIQSDFIEPTDPLKYQESANTLSFGKEMINIKFRYKLPGTDKSKLIEHPVNDLSKDYASTSDNFRFVAAVVEFGMLLTNSEFKQGSSFTNALDMAKSAMERDQEGYRKEFVSLLQTARQLVPAKEEVISQEQQSRSRKSIVNISDDNE